MLLYLPLFAMLTISHTAIAQSIACAALEHGKAPFQVNTVNGDGKPGSIQIYRNDDLYRVQYTGAIKTVFQANFVKNTRLANGKTVETTWSILTKEFVWDQGLNSARSRITGSKEGVWLTQTL